MLVTDPSSSSAASYSQNHGRKVPTESEKKASDRFYCPYEGCNRSFAELWRLKVHYRASPDVRGSGKERGHGAELESCPKCEAELKPGRHHVGCAAGKQAVAQHERRRILKGKKRADCTNNPNALNSARRPNEGDTAIGVPVSWLPLDFDQFFIPIGSNPASAFHANPAALSSRYRDPAARDFCMADSMANLVYGNYGEMPAMVTTQVGLESDLDLDFSNYFKDEVLDGDSNLHTSLQHPQAFQCPPLTKPLQTDEEEQDLNDGQCNLTAMEDLTHSVGASLFDGLDVFQNHYNDIDCTLHKEMETSRKRDRGPSLEQSEKQKQKPLLPRYYSHKSDRDIDTAQSRTSSQRILSSFPEYEQSTVLWGSKGLLHDSNRNDYATQAAEAASTVAMMPLNTAQEAMLVSSFNVNDNPYEVKKAAAKKAMESLTLDEEKDSLGTLLENLQDFDTLYSDPAFPEENFNIPEGR